MRPDINPGEGELTTLLILGVIAWLAWAWLEFRGARHERASQATALDHARTEATEAARSDTTQAMHRGMRSARHTRGLMAGRAYPTSDERWAADVRQHRASTHQLQSEERRSDGRARRELPTSSSAGHPPLVSP